MDSEDDVFGFGGSPGQEEEVEEEDQTVPCLEDPMEDTVKGVKDLLSRFHGTDEPENNMKRERVDSGSDVLGSPKTPRKDETGSSGKFIFRSARTEDPLHFIHRIRLSNTDNTDQETEDLVTIIRSTDPSSPGENKEAKLSLITAALVRQFEQATESDGKRPRDSEDDGEEEGGRSRRAGETSSEAVSMATDQFSDSEEESTEEAVSMSLKERLADQEEEKTKERASTSSLDGAELDFNVLENSRPLNLDATKQRVVLRQKGSLAKRRRPTRSSLRVAAPEGGKGGDVEDSKASSEDFADSDEEEEEDQQQNGRMSCTTNDHAGKIPYRAGKPMAGIRAPVLLPGLGESIRSPKLKSLSKPPIPKPAAETNGEDAPAPAWLAETRLRKTSRPPRGEVEKLKQETEPEKPSWMKEVAAKKMKAPADTDSVDSMEVTMVKAETKVTSENSEETPVVPWMRETARRRSSRPTPMTFKTPVSTSSPLEPKETELSWEKEANHKCSKDVMTPIRRPSVEEEKEHDENIPPGGQDPADRLLPSITDAQQKSALPPLKPSTSGMSQSSSNSSREQDLCEEGMPSWKQEIAHRRRSKQLVMPPRPDAPLKMTETPSWKKQLLEKQKQRRESDTSSPTTKASDSSPNTSVVPPWQQELAQRRKRSGIFVPRVLDNIENDKDKTDAPTPEWAKQVERRRVRLANSGLFRTDSEESH